MFVLIFPQVKELLDSYTGRFSMLVQKYSSQIDDLIDQLQDFIQLIEETIDLDLAKKEDEYVIKYLWLQFY